jgi:hypothetical protein
MKMIRYLLLRYLLRWYCSEDMDQWERWVLWTDKGPAYIEIDWLAGLGGHESYEDMDKPNRERQQQGAGDE